MNISLIRPCGEQSKFLQGRVFLMMYRKKDTYMLLAKNARKSMLLKNSCLLDGSGGRGKKKSGVPKNAGMSNDVYENKGQNKLPFRMSSDVYGNR